MTNKSWYKLSNHVTIPKPTPTNVFKFHILHWLPKQNKEPVEESWGWPFLPLNKFGE